MFLGIFQTIPLPILVALSDLLLSILVLLVSSASTVNLVYRLFTATWSLTVDMFLAPGISQPCNASNDTHLRSTASQVFTANPFRSQSCGSRTIAFIRFRNTVILLFVLNVSAVRHMPLFKRTLTKDVNPYRDVS